VRIDLLWFRGCPNHETAERWLNDAMAERGIEAPIHRIQVEDEEAGNAVMFPGSPTIRVNGRDIEPGWQPCDDCSPRCRVYLTPEGLRGLPDRAWIDQALDAALAAER